MIIKLDPTKVAKIENQQRSLLTLSLTQLITGLVKEKWIRDADGIEWAGGTLPDTVISLIQDLPVDEQIAAKLQALSPIISRLDTIIVLLGNSNNKSLSEIDEFFKIYSKI